MDIREWGVVLLILVDEIGQSSILAALWMMCPTVHSKWWFWSKLIKTAFLEWGVRRLTLINKFEGWYYKLHWIDAYWGKLLDECCWVAQWWCVVKLIWNKCSHIACVYYILEWCLLLLTLIYKIIVLQLKPKWSEVCSTSLPNEYLILSYVA